MKLFVTSRQAPLFVVFFCLGVLLGIIYDLFYLFRCRKPPVITGFFDIIFSFLAFILTVHFVQFFNSGAIKIFMFFAIFLGFIIERVTLGFFIKIFMDFFMKILYNLYKRLNIKKYLSLLLK